MKNAERLALMFGALALAADGPRSKWPDEAPRKVKNTEPVRYKGHKMFIIDGVEIWALNEKNAIKKSRK